MIAFQLRLFCFLRCIILNKTNANSTTLDLSNNNLAGIIPNSLISLEHIDLSYNALEGEVTQEFLDKFHDESFIGNPNLHVYELFMVTPPSYPTVNKRGNRGRITLISSFSRLLPFLLLCLFRESSFSVYAKLRHLNLTDLVQGQ